MSYDDALRELYQVPHGRFVAERKRLAAELRARGDRASAAKLLELARPPISAWVVNQLYWHARDVFDDMLATAARLRDGELGAASAHRDAIARLRQRAATMLADAGHAASEPILRRVTASLAAIAAAAGFDPDPPGALAADRAAPGFEAVGAMPAPSRADEATEPAPEQERAARRAERERVAAALRTARGDVEAAERRARAAEQELRDAEASVAKAGVIVEDLERRLATLDE